MRTLIAIACIGFLSAGVSAHAATVLITGSDRGLGLEFARQYAERRDSVIATCRHPEKAVELKALASTHKDVVVEQLDVSDDAQIKALAAKYKGRPIDILINNAGVLGTQTDQTLGTLSRQSFHEVMDVNAFGALAVSEALRANVVSSTQKKIIAITSGAGSISVAGGMPQGPYYYRMSKAAMDMGMRALGADLKSQQVVVALVAPGAVDTDMQTEFRSAYMLTRKYPIETPTQAVSKMIAVIDKVDQAKAEQGINLHDGTIMPW